MRRTVEKVLSQHGTDLTIVSGLEQKTVRGFFRAVNSKSWQSMESEATLLGEITRGQYVYMGPVDAAVKEKHPDYFTVISVDKDMIKK